MSIAADLAIITEQERTLRFPRFDHNTAWELGTHLRALAAERNLAIVIDVRRFGHPLFFTALPGTTPDNFDWVRRKTNTVARFLQSSYAIGLKLEAKQSTLTLKYALPDVDYAAHGGCFPITVIGAGVIGCVTVSGLPQRADHELVIEALCLLLAQPYDSLRLPAVS